MLWFNIYFNHNRELFFKISIHLMLWFNWNNPIFNSLCHQISIHLMLWFNFSLVTTLVGRIAISIHLMLWFNGTGLAFDGEPMEFQYILCCGSTFYVLSYTGMRVGFQYILCCGSTQDEKYRMVLDRGISIHLMLWFNYLQ